jgi:hypothetical protein
VSLESAIITDNLTNLIKPVAYRVEGQIDLYHSPVWHALSGVLNATKVPAAFARKKCEICGPTHDRTVPAWCPLCVSERIPLDFPAQFRHRIKMVKLESPVFKDVRITMLVAYDAAAWVSLVDWVTMTHWPNSSVWIQRSYVIISPNLMDGPIWTRHSNNNQRNLILKIKQDFFVINAATQRIAPLLHKTDQKGQLLSSHTPNSDGLFVSGIIDDTLETVQVHARSAPAPSHPAYKPIFGAEARVIQAHILNACLRAKSNRAVIERLKGLITNAQAMISDLAKEVDDATPNP